MATKIVVERLEFQARCGVTPDERRTPQALAIDMELEGEIGLAAQSGSLTDTIDYSLVTSRIVAIGSSREWILLESLSECFLSMLFDEFPIEKAKLWLRKLTPPLSDKVKSVGIHIERGRVAQQHDQSGVRPLRFLTQNLHRLTKGRALYVASGSGRNALYLAEHGFDVEALDRDTESLTKLSAAAALRHLHLTVKPIDLERTTDERPEFPANSYDVIVVSFYLYRPLFPWMIDALKPNGILVYETFSIENYFRHRHPRRWEFCLAHNELLRLTSALKVLAYDEGEHEGTPDSGTAFTAQLIAQKAGTHVVS